jgi:hypothetical protein
MAMTDNRFSITWYGKYPELRYKHALAVLNQRLVDGVLAVWARHMPVQCLRVRNVHCGVHEQKAVLRELWR